MVGELIVSELGGRRNEVAVPKLVADAGMRLRLRTKSFFSAAFPTSTREPHTAEASGISYGGWNLRTARLSRRSRRAWCGSI
jgi:hypothetical protein